jgi:hypothetical protein
MTSDSRRTVVAALGATQTIAWASSYYMPAILGGPIARTLDLPTSVFFGLFSGLCCCRQWSAHRLDG